MINRFFSSYHNLLYLMNIYILSIETLKLHNILNSEGKLNINDVKRKFWLKIDGKKLRAKNFYLFKLFLFLISSLPKYIKRVVHFKKTNLN